MCIITKALHGAHKVGSYWQNIPGYEHRADCRKCGVPDDLEHLLTDCDGPCQQIIWTEARKLWERTGIDWPTITIGLIMGCGLMEIRPGEGDKPDPGLTRLYRILISESAYLIWKLRCERVITHDDPEHDWHPETEVLRRWEQAINLRFKLDQAMTSVRFRNKAVKRRTVLNTWRTVIAKNAGDLPKDWIGRTGVLVGKRRARAGNIRRLPRDEG